MSSGLKLEYRKGLASRFSEHVYNDHAYRRMFSRLMKRMRSIATAAYVHAT